MTTAQSSMRSQHVWKQQLEALEIEIHDELHARAEQYRSPDVPPHHPITDGIVDVDQYLASIPRMLWILKEPWEDFDENGSGGWSLTRNLIPELIADRKIGGASTYRKMAYVAYSVFNHFKPYHDIPYDRDDPQVGQSLRRIAYINVSKFPGRSTSKANSIAAAYQRNQALLRRQIAAINPDVIIFGNIIHLFLADLGIQQRDLQSAGSVDYCRQNSRLIINAYHPAYWRCKEETYVNDLVAVIKQHAPS